MLVNYNNPGEGLNKHSWKVNRIMQGNEEVKSESWYYLSCHRGAAGDGQNKQPNWRPPATEYCEKHKVEKKQAQMTVLCQILGKLYWKHLWNNVVSYSLR